MYQGFPEVTANIYCELRNLPNTDTQNYSTSRSVRVNQIYNVNFEYHEG